MTDIKPVCVAPFAVKVPIIEAVVGQLKVMVPAVVEAVTVADGVHVPVPCGAVILRGIAPAEPEPL